MIDITALVLLCIRTRHDEDLVAIAGGIDRGLDGVEVGVRIVVKQVVDHPVVAVGADDVAAVVGVIAGDLIGFVARREVVSN